VVHSYHFADIFLGIVVALNKVIQGVEGKRKQLEGQWALLR
jgi:hypothetical protein